MIIQIINLQNNGIRTIKYLKSNIRVETQRRANEL
jgi:hypothetical protein